MKRRDFVKKSLAGAAGSIVAGSRVASLHALDTPDKPIAENDWRDPRLRALHLTVPAFRGRRYLDAVPDTLDLTDRARLSINAMTRLLDPQYDYTQFQVAELRASPPVLILAAGGLTVLNPKWAEALPLMRMMTGSTENEDIDHHLIESFIHNTGKDGLVYQPPQDPGAFSDEYTRKQGKPYAWMWGEGRQLLTYSIWTQLSSDPVYRHLAERKIARLRELAVAHQDTFYFRKALGYTPGEKPDTADVYTYTDGVVMDPRLGVVGTAAAYAVSPVAMGLARYYLVTGYEPALELSRGLTYYFRRHARLIDDSGKWYGWHFHVVATGILGAVEYGIAANDRDLLGWCQRAYEYGKSIGDPMIGFFAGIPRAEPADFNPNVKENGRDSSRMETEPCSISDMLLIALKLSRAGVADYYEDVEYYIRNLLLEEQITNLDFLPSFPKAISDQVNKGLHKMAPNPRQISSDHAAERAVGSFVNSRPNQWYLEFPGPIAGGCCLGNASRALYYTWDSILQQDGNTLRVNLLLNRASPWADLYSYLPYEGKVRLKMKQPRTVLVRIPHWTDRQRVACSVNGKRREQTWDGSYIRVGPVGVSDDVVITFPMVESTLQRQIKSQTYTVTFRGFTVSDLQPKPEVTPLFQRTSYREASTPVRRVTRFVPEERVIW